MKISKEFQVGLFMVMAILLLYFGFSFLKGTDFLSSTNKYYAFYENVDNLTESNQIYLNGLAVGRVSDITIQQRKNRVLVELEIDSDIILGDSSIAVLNGELLGGRFIQLIVGKDSKLLEPKDTIRSEIAKGLMDFLTESAEPVAANLQTTLKKLNIILDGLAKNTKQLDTMFIRLQTTPGLINKTLNTANTNIGELSGSFKSVAGNLNGTLNELKPTLENFKTLSDSLKMLQLNGTLSKAQETLARLNETLAKLNKGDNTASKLMTDDELYNNLNKLLLSMDSLANHLNENPKHFFAPLGKSKKKIERELNQQQEEKEKAQKP
ncbi:MAG: MCE family protein [Cyclobacteriaceae bacterium]|nr:MCE family protein [Cyclobacteriaceae bacterium]